MDKSPVFSVIVPTYNRRHFLERAIDSILMQTFKDFELIIVDDGSTDNTKELVDSYKDDRIIYFYKENGGINSARNLALQNAKGEYIAFCDSDDRWMPDKLEKHIQKYYEDKEVKVVYDWTGIVIEKNGNNEIILARKDAIEGWCFGEVLEQGYLTSPTFLSCKKECFEIIGMMPEYLTFCEDDELCFNLCKHFKVGLVKEILGIYYTDAANRICDKKKLCADDYLKFQERWRDEIVKVCGNEVLSHRYFHAAYNYLDIYEIDTANYIYQQACTIKGVSLREVKNKIKSEVIKDGKVVIYGVGHWGRVVFNALLFVGFSDFLFVVTDLMKSPKELEGIPVREIGDVNVDIDSTIIIASSRYYKEMRGLAQEKGFNRIVAYKDIIEVIFDRSF